MTPDVLATNLSDLVLRVPSYDPVRWRESRYEPFLDELCQDREYQKEAIRIALRYVLGGSYADLRALARENWQANTVLHDQYGTFERMEERLQLPDLLSGTIDLATGTGKSYVIYGIATIVLAEDAVDRVLVLCPSTTIEAGLLRKFRTLATDAALRDSLPSDVAVRSPSIIDASETIIPGSLCVENRDAVYEHVRSSIRDSLGGKGARVAVLNDEVHHVANQQRQRMNRWKEFLTKPEYDFRIALGFSGTCWIGNEYFSDVIYRYALREAIEERTVKSVAYLAESETSGEEDGQWQLIVNRHEATAAKLRRRGILPLSIVVTATIAGCKRVGEELRHFLCERCGWSSEEAEERVLVVYNGAPDVVRLADIDTGDCPVEWIVSVSMLNEGWDVKRVFQVVPHEERAFNSKLLIAQVLGRGLRIPDGWEGPQPEVTVFNHAAWASRIRGLVSEVLENERRITSKPMPASPFHFDVHDLSYASIKDVEVVERSAPFALLSKGFVDIPSESTEVAVAVRFENAASGGSESWESTIRRRTYTPAEVAVQMFNLLEMLDEESRGTDAPTTYAKQYTLPALTDLVKHSLERSGHTGMYVTESNRQKFLQALGTVRRRSTKVVRYRLDPQQVVIRSTQERSAESASASQLRRDHIAFVAPSTRATLESDQLEFFDELIEPGSSYRCVRVENAQTFRTPLNLVIADSENEYRFVRELLKDENAAHLDGWVKSTRKGFYAIHFSWKKGEHQKRARFSPDFFLKTPEGVFVVEIKDEDELHDPSPENAKKYQFAQEHFERLEAELGRVGDSSCYSCHFLAPSDFIEFFKRLREGNLLAYRSRLDVALEAAAQRVG